MSKMVQIRNVPETLHRKLKVRAADAGQTLSDYLLAELERLAARPTRDEMLTRLHGQKRVTLKTPAAVVVREERASVVRVERFSGTTTTSIHLTWQTLK